MHSVVSTFGLDVPSRGQKCVLLDLTSLHLDHTVCLMHVESKKSDKSLWKHLHSVGLELFAAIRIGVFDDLN